MSPSIIDESQPQYLLLTMEGVWENARVPETSDRILDFCVQHKSTRVLIDMRKFDGNPSTLDRFQMATYFSMKYLKLILAGDLKPCRFAVIGNHPLVDPQRFEETVSVNKGLPVKTFTDLDQALAWLLRD